MADRATAELPAEILSAAAQWHARITAGTDAHVQARFEQWRAEDTRHRAAYDWMAEHQSSARDLADTPEILSLRQQTMARIMFRRTRSQRAKVVVAAAFALLMLPIAGWIGSRHLTGDRPAVARTQDFQTAVGQQLALTLADGSRVTLNTASRLKVMYGKDERRLLLVEGQAWFDVAKDSTRPFVVLAGGERIVAHGTQFDVRLRDDQVEVMLAEGRVSVSPATSRHNHTRVTLAPRQLLTISRSGSSLSTVNDTEAWGSWRKGILMFQDMTLAQAVEEMNRYSTVQLQLADAATGATRISGAFRAGDNTTFTEALDMAFGIRARRTESGNIVLSRDS